MTTTTMRLAGWPGRRRAILGCLRAFFALVLILAVYSALPSAANTEASSWVALTLGLTVFVAVLVWQVREVGRSSYPVIRAVEALAISVTLFLILFATQYVAESAASTQAFSEPLDKFTGLYYTVTVFSTVGFGDITPVSQLARGLSMVQMLGNLIILGIGIRVLTSVAQENIQRRRATSAGPAVAVDRD